MTSKPDRGFSALGASFGNTMMRVSLLLAIILAFVACSEAFLGPSALPLRARNVPMNCVKMSDPSPSGSTQATRGGESLNYCGHDLVAASPPRSYQPHRRNLLEIRKLGIFFATNSTSSWQRFRCSFAETRLVCNFQSNVDSQNHLLLLPSSLLRQQLTRSLSSVEPSLILVLKN